MGSAERFFDKETRTGAVPGPGQYKLPPSVGGNNPAMASKPVYAFGKDGARHIHSTRAFSADPCSPGPGASYKMVAGCGPQVSSSKRQQPIYGFGTGARFPVSPEENRQHRLSLKMVNRQRPATSAN